MVNSTFKNANILIVDDQESNIDILEGLLEMQGYTNIKTTTDPRKVVQLFSAFQPDLILLDLAMPYLSGFEVMEQLKFLVPASSFLPILVLTADVTTEARQKALSGGASDFLTKPFDLVEVGLRIRNLLFTNYLVKQLENQNQVLEEKVKERTRELEQINIDLILARDKAEASDRLKTAFMNNISHEIRTPLNGILGFAPMVMDPAFSDQDKQEFLDILNFSSRRLMQTVTDYMDISLLASGNIEVNNNEFKPSDVLAEIMKQYQPLCNEKNLSLRVEKPSSFDSWNMYSDKGLLKKVLAHLTDNAIKFTREGTITISISDTPDPLGFSIQDTGLGISEQAIPNIFEHFVQEDISSTRGHEGSGLGLAIVNGLVTLLGGTVQADSVKGQGSTFTLSIPDATSAGKTPADEIPVRSDTSSHRPMILVAEDEAVGYMFLELTLNTSYEILRAENGEEAVELCRSIPGIQLVLMDVKMPKMNGLIATQEIKKLRKDLPIIVLTAYAETGIREKCFNAGCDEYLAKPIAKDDLFSSLAKFGFKV